MTSLALLRVARLAGLGALLCVYPNSHSAQADPGTVAVGYQDGYAEGCDTGIANAWRDRVSAGLPLIDDKPDRYAHERDFQVGWDAGQKSCFEGTRYPQKFLPGVQSP